MHCLAVAFTAIAAFYGTALAQDPGFDSIYKPSKGENVPAGKTYTIKWDLGSDKLTGPATITLLAGADSTTLQPVGTIGSVDNEALKFDWAVNATLGSEALYGISIALDATPAHFQYSPGFLIVGGTAAKSSGSASSSVGSSGSIGVTVTTSTTAAGSSVFTTTTTSSTIAATETGSNGTVSAISPSSPSSSSSSSYSSTASATATSSKTSASASATVITTSAGNRQAHAASGALSVALIVSIAFSFMYL